MKNIIEIENLSKSYDGKKFALLNCSFSLSEGKVCAVVGESGSGKSTLLRLIAGLERPDSGSIKIKGKVVSDDSRILPPQQRNVGLVFQDFALFPHLTVEQNIVYGLRHDKGKRLGHVLELIKMKEYANAYPSELSGGQEQRVALARTLALSPELLLLDEPFSNLDTGLKSELRGEISRIVKDLGASMIFITHDFFDAIDIADEIIVLKDGAILQHSSIDEFPNEIRNSDVDEMVMDLRYNAERLLDLMQKKK